MSLESKIQELTDTVARLIDAINGQQNAIVAPAPVAPQVAAPKPVEVVAPVVAPVPVAPPPAPVVEAPAMPAPPTFAPVVQEVAPPVAPFNDGKTLIEYVMGAYKALGPQKGAQIQNVLTQLGYQNINDVKPEHYVALYQGVEALKG